MPEGSYPTLTPTREGKLALDIYDTYGGAYIAQESFSSMFRNRLLPWLKLTVEKLKPHLFDSSESEGVFVNISTTNPASSLAEARLTTKHSDQYNLTLTITIGTNASNAWTNNILVPVIVGSRHCNTYKQPSIIRQEMGVGTGDPGGYLLNMSGGLVIVRPCETAHPAKPKIISGDSIDDCRARSIKHGENAPYVLSKYVEMLAEKGIVTSTFARNYEYTDYVQSALQGDDSFVERIEKPTPKKVTTKAKKISKANSAAERAILGQDVFDDPVVTESAPLYENRATDTLKRLIDCIPVVINRKKNKKPLSPATEKFLVRCTFENIYALPTVIEIYATGLVFYVWISLPAVNTKLHVQLPSYIPQAQGATAIGGRLLSIIHALFYARERNLQHFYKIGMKNYSSEILEVILSVVPEEDRTGLEACMGTSFKQYNIMCELLSPLELFASFFVESPTVVNIFTPHHLVEYVTDYIVPISNSVGGDIWVAKARTLATMLAVQYRSVETGGSSDLHEYKNKYVTTAGITIFKYIRERIYILLASRISKDQAMISKNVSPTCILSSFKTRTGNGVVRGDNNAQATMNLIWETQQKTTTSIRTIVVPGSVHVPQSSRLVKFDQIGNICPMYTPESEDVGKRKELAFNAVPSLYRDPEIIYEFLRSALILGAAKSDTRFISHEMNPAAQDMRLLYIEAVPVCYISRQFYNIMRNYFRTNGPVRPEAKHYFDMVPQENLPDAQSLLKTFDIVFSDTDNRYAIYHTGGIIGHLALVAKNGKLLIDDTDWNSDIDTLINAGMLAFVAPMEVYFECSSVIKFYDTPSIRDMPLVDGKHTRDIAIIKECQDLCPWCWHLAMPPNSERKSFRLNSHGKEDPGIYGNVSVCGCGRHWHEHCKNMWNMRVGTGMKTPLDDDKCAVCTYGLDEVPPPPANFREDYDYVLADPAVILGASASSVPNAGESYGVRAAYQSNMNLQSLDSQSGIDQKRELLNKSALEADVSLCITELDEHNQRDAHHGVNLMVATRMLRLNNEDGLIVSETAARECLRYVYRQTITAPATRVQNSIKHGMKWYVVVGEYMGLSKGIDETKFHAIDRKTGIPRIGAFLHPGDAIYARYAITKDGTIIDTSKYCSVENYGYVTQVNLRNFNHNPESGSAVVVMANTYLSVTISLSYCYMVGDKLCARYSQKGVIAAIYPRKMMGRIVGGPFDGCVPDAIHAPTIIPTRMTVGILTEYSASKVALLTCEIQNATAFRNRTGKSDEFRMTKNPVLAKYAKILDEYGCPGGAMESYRASNGTVETVLFGPVRYLMLRHHAAMKTKRSVINPRRVGTDIFRQSTRGREGNLRIGLQEGQGYYSMGTPYMLQGLISMGTLSEGILVCESCGIAATLPPATGFKHVCDVCAGNLRGIKTAYSLIVLMHILATRGIEIRLFPAKTS
jgi:hypothetical protein